MPGVARRVFSTTEDVIFDGVVVIVSVFLSQSDLDELRTKLKILHMSILPLQIICQPPLRFFRICSLNLNNMSLGGHDNRCAPFFLTEGVLRIDIEIHPFMIALVIKVLV